MLTVITGGARSGKSKFAQSLCRDAARVVYLATALPNDEEMRARISHHQRSRPSGWLTVEEPIQIPEIAARHVADADFLLIDCLTVWLGNLFYEWRDEDVPAIEEKAADRAGRLIAAAKRGNIVAVTNEVGSGIVPEAAVARNFRDIQGSMNQQLARAADAVYLVVSGIPMCIKPVGGRSTEVSQ